MCYQVPVQSCTVGFLHVRNPHLKAGNNVKRIAVYPQVHTTSKTMTKESKKIISLTATTVYVCFISTG